MNDTSSVVIKPDGGAKKDIL